MTTASLSQVLSWAVCKPQPLCGFRTTPPKHHTRSDCQPHMHCAVSGTNTSAQAANSMLGECLGVSPDACQKEADSICLGTLTSTAYRRLLACQILLGEGTHMSPGHCNTPHNSSCAAAPMQLGDSDIYLHEHMRQCTFCIAWLT